MRYGCGKYGVPGRKALAGRQPTPLTGGVERPAYILEDEWTGRTDLSASQRKRLRRALRGVCRWCNAARVPGRVMCERHRALVAERNREAYRRKADEHLSRYGVSAHRLRAMAGWSTKRLVRALIG